ncbi:MAG: two-component system NtrC family sensor kinase [Desulforhopalus sp.]|jgi:two-component system NtrC family sensor kinase
MKSDTSLFSEKDQNIPSEKIRRTISKGIGVEIFNSLQDPLILVTPEGIITEVNPALIRAAQKGYDDVIGRGICEIIHGGRWPHIECPLEEFLRTCTPRVEDTRLPGLGGEYSLSIIPVTPSETGEQLILLIARLLTKEEIRKVDSIRTAQLAAIGELAAGVAHEVNNPINGIINFAQLLLDDCPKESSQAEILTKIVTEGERIATIIYNLLSFAREPENSFGTIDLNQVVRDSISLVGHQLKYDGIVVITDLLNPSCLITGNFSQLQQVVLNLISNSRYALNERYRQSVSKKRIEITTQIVTLEEVDYCRLTVRDFGTGIPQSILNKMFEPFFTSKPAAKGSGLGLSISYGIVSNHNGLLRVDSILNKYTDLIIEIPASEG